MKVRFKLSPHGQPSWLALLLMVLLSFSGGCGKKQQVSEFSKECSVPDDQSATFIGRWKLAPVPIAFHEGDFTDAEIKAITSAATTWNRFFAASMGFQGLDFLDSSGSVRTVSESKPLYSCTNVIFDTQSSEYSGVIVIYKQKFWGYKDKATTIARTSTCPDATHFFYSGFIEINYESFFIPGRQVPDLESVILHEFGHLLGLKHSCEENAGGEGMPNCSSTAVNPAYKSASMYPNFGYNASGEGEKRRKINSNDQGRMNCLYKE